MNEIVKKILSARNKLIPDMHLRQPGFTHNACGPFTKTSKEYKSFKKQEIQDIFIKTN